MVLVRKFFCFDLYTTGLLIGWLGLAESITSCIFSILMLENIDGIIRPEQFPDPNNVQQIRMSEHFQNKLVFSLYDTLLLRILWGKTTHIISVISTMLSVYIAFNVIDLLASGLLIAGTVKVLHYFDLVLFFFKCANCSRCNWCILT